MKSTTNRPSDDARTVLVWRRVPVASVTVTRAPGWKLVPTNDGSPSRVGRIDAAASLRDTRWSSLGGRGGQRDQGQRASDQERHDAQRDTPRVARCHLSRGAAIADISPPFLKWGYLLALCPTWR